MLVWTDRRLTLWLWLGLLASSALLAILASFIPWGFVFGLIMRLVGLAIFGPHMIWVTLGLGLGLALTLTLALALTPNPNPNPDPNPNQVGRWLDAQTAVAMAKEEEYDLADDKRQKAMLDEVGV